MNYNIKIFIFLTLFIFVFLLLFPLDTRAIPMCECFDDWECDPGNYCDETERCTVSIDIEGVGICKPCECYDNGEGWYDIGTCSGPSEDPNNPCSPFTEQEYCDGCLWDDIRCVGNPMVCSSGETECRTGDQVFECDGDRCGWQLKEDCDDSDGWYDTGSTRWVSASDCTEKKQKEQVYRDYYCSGSGCTYNTGSSQWLDTGDTRNKTDGTDCGTDTCIGSTYRDYSCSAGSCTYTDSGYDSRCNNPPDIPTLETPLHNVWIDYNPTFKATVSDPDGDQVRAHFNVVGYGSGVGTWVESGGISEWGPVNLGDCAEYSWRSYTEDASGLESGWYGYWLVKVDKGAPSSSVDYPTGTIDYTTFTVNLTESGGCFGVVEGDVDIDISTDGGTTWSGWQDHLSTTDDFNYTGSDGYCYEFRYRVKNEKDNWSDWVEGGEACVQLAPSCECSSSDGPCCKDDCNFDDASIVCDTETGYQCSTTECGADFQSRTRDRYCSGSAAACTGSYGSWSGWSTIEDCTDLQLCYTTSPYCRDDLSCIAANTPNIPTIEVPPNDTWINYDPTFEATATDPDGDDVRTYFSVSDSGDGWGSWTDSGGVSQWGPTDLGACAQHSWRAYSEDTDGLKSDWSGYWQVKVDKDAPDGSISYSIGSICGVFRVTLTESDDCSGISQGEVEISIDEGDWQDYTNTVDDFDYTGSDGYSYEFRYRVQDSAGNWSNWSIGEEASVINCDDSDGCYPYDSGCEDRDYFCSDGGCDYSSSNQQTDSYDSYVNYCSGTTARKQRLFYDWYCDGGACAEHISWQDDELIEDCGSDYWTDNYRCEDALRQREYVSQGCKDGACYSNNSWQNVKNCGSDYCEDWYVCGCDVNYIKECRTCHSQGCSDSVCYDNAFVEERKTITNCDDSDTCIGTTYRDYSCSEGACGYTDKTCDSYCDVPPNIPILQVPSNDSWLNYDPIFKAGVSDIDEDDVRTYFNVSDYGDNWGEQTRSGEVSQWGPVNLGTCAEYWWRAYSQDVCGFNSDWSGYWKVKVDKDLPSNSINYSDGVIYSNTFAVTLNESDDCSGIKGGDVDFRIDSGDWQYFGNTIDNFDFVGSYGRSYQLRYRVKDNADNWSDFIEGGIIELRVLPEIALLGVDWICCPEWELVFSWDYSDFSNSPQAGFQIQIDDNDDFSSPVIDIGEISDSQTQYVLTGNDISKLSEEIEYFWQVRVKNAYGDWSEWKTDESSSIFIKELETYSTF